MPAMTLSRVGARVVESGPGDQDLPAGTGQRLESLLTRAPRRVDLPACLPDRDRGHEPTLLIAVAPATGLTRQAVDQALTWARQT